MFIISGEKGTGKTKALLEKAKEENSIIACEDVLAMRIRAYDYGITGLDIVSYADLFESTVTTEGRPVYIHDINKFIRGSIPSIKGYTLNLD
jgi:hypothetical protein